MKKAGITLMILGLVLTVFTAVTIFTRERIVDMGDLKISVNKPHHLNWSPMIGVGFIICGGIVFFLTPSKQR
jgi:Na+-transporting NADH:ubiquinone oxidoreductase subunit NqrF